MSELREQLAKLAHDQWAGWMTYLFSKGEYVDGGEWRMPRWAVDRWNHQRVTAYQDLSDDEKDSDRGEADKFLAVFGVEIRDLERQLLTYEDSISVKLGCIADLGRQVEELAAFKADIDEQYEFIMDETCSLDEKHCTCVPAFRRLVANLEQQVADHNNHGLDVVEKLEAAEKRFEAADIDARNAKIEVAALEHDLGSLMLPSSTQLQPWIEKVVARLALLPGDHWPSAVDCALDERAALKQRNAELEGFVVDVHGATSGYRWWEDIHEQATDLISRSKLPKPTCSVVSIDFDDDVIERPDKGAS